MDAFSREMRLDRVAVGRALQTGITSFSRYKGRCDRCHEVNTVTMSRHRFVWARERGSISERWRIAARNGLPSSPLKEHNHNKNAETSGCFHLGPAAWPLKIDFLEGVHGLNASDNQRPSIF